MKRGLPHRNNERSQSEQEERPGHWRTGRQEEQRAYGRGDEDDDNGNAHPRGDCGRNHIWADGEERERNPEEEKRGH